MTQNNIIPLHHILTINRELFCLTITLLKRNIENQILLKSSTQEYVLGNKRNIFPHLQWQLSITVENVCNKYQHTFIQPPLPLVHPTIHGPTISPSIQLTPTLTPCCYPTTNTTCPSNLP